MQKDHEKAYHDFHIKKCTFKNEDLVLLCDSNFTNFPGKFYMHWMGPYIIKEITNGNAIQLAKLNEELFLGKFNGSQLMLYRGDPSPMKRIYGCKIVLVLQVVAMECGSIKYTAKRKVGQSDWVA